MLLRISEPDLVMCIFNNEILTFLAITSVFSASHYFHQLENTSGQSTVLPVSYGTKQSPDPPSNPSV